MKGIGTTEVAQSGAPLSSTYVFVPTMHASYLPAHMADDDGRGRIVELCELCKQWAVTTDEHRSTMIAEPPRRLRWYHRFTSRRNDLARIAAVVHALCVRDSIVVPSWIWQHRSRRHIGFNGKKAGMIRNPEWWVDFRVPVAVCAFHRVWFDAASIENITVHGLSRPPMS